MKKNDDVKCMNCQNKMRLSGTLIQAKLKWYVCPNCKKEKHIEVKNEYSK